MCRRVGRVAGGTASIELPLRARCRAANIVMVARLCGRAAPQLVHGLLRCWRVERLFVECGLKHWSERWRALRTRAKSVLYFVLVDDYRTLSVLFSELVAGQEHAAAVLHTAEKP